MGGVSSTAPNNPSVEPAAEPRQTRLLIVTGMTGAGRTTAAHALEDIGWYLVDNLPPGVMLDTLTELHGAGIFQVAVVLDVRSRTLFGQLRHMFDRLNAENVSYDVLYLEAAEDIILRRQESARRPHPLQGTGRVVDGVTAEREQLAPMRAVADLVINTSELNPHQLAARIVQAYGQDTAAKLRAVVMSFGFKNGTPVDADLVTDVRFLPNPHWVPELRAQTGLSAAVSKYVLGQVDAGPFLDQLLGLVLIQRAGYLREGKRLITIAIGCTGGKHRSTAMSEALASKLREEGIPTGVFHRDLGLE